MADTCKSCSAPIEWVKSARTGKAMPLDIEPTDNGNLVVIDGVAHPRLAGDTKPRRTSHFATCPQAESWRRR
jgi:hypothetical protein